MKIYLKLFITLVGFITLLSSCRASSITRYNEILKILNWKEKAVVSLQFGGVSYQKGLSPVIYGKIVVSKYPPQFKSINLNCILASVNTSRSNRTHISSIAYVHTEALTLSENTTTFSAYWPMDKQFSLDELLNSLSVSFKNNCDLLSPLTPKQYFIKKHEL
jgi:hypothetical protein